MVNPIEIYTDGSSVSNENVFVGSGWAYYIPALNIGKSGKVYNQKNNSIARMELMAVVEALKCIAHRPGHYVIYCDNLSTVKCFRGEGARKIYKDLWNEVYALIRKAYELGSIVDVQFLNRKALDQKSERFSYAQTVDRMAYQCANSLCLA